MAEPPNIHVCIISDVIDLHLSDTTNLADLIYVYVYIYIIYLHTYIYRDLVELGSPF